MAIAETVLLAAARLDATPAQVALAWVLAASPVIVPIPGTRRPERVAENAAAALLVLPDEERKVLDDLPAPTGSRY